MAKYRVTVKWLNDTPVRCCMPGQARSYQRAQVNSREQLHVNRVSRLFPNSSSRINEISNQIGVVAG